MSEKNQRIDLFAQNTLSEDQCDVAVAIWLKHGVFDIESETIKQNEPAQYREEKIWSITFNNYSTYNVSHFNRLVKFTTQIINHYQKKYDFAGVSRFNVRKGDESVNYICKLSKKDALSGYKGRVSSAATNLVKADKMNDAFDLAHKTFHDFLQRTEVVLPDLIDRMKFRRKMVEAIVAKDKADAKLLEQMNGSVAGIEAAEPTEQASEDLEGLGIELNLDKEVGK